MEKWDRLTLKVRGRDDFLAGRKRGGYQNKSQNIIEKGEMANRKAAISACSFSLSIISYRMVLMLSTSQQGSGD